MTYNELWEAKDKDHPVNTPLGIGQINGIGKMQTYIYFPLSKPVNDILGYLKLISNSDIKPAN